MIALTVEEIVSLQEKIIAKTGGRAGVRDVKLLEYTAFVCSLSSSDLNLYKSIEDKAARMAYGICQNHPFFDGNKRTAIMAMLVMLRVNGFKISYTQKELISLALDLANGGLEPKAVKDWLCAHKG
jgi:death-on-curing protein